MPDPLNFMERDSLTIWGDSISAQIRYEKDLKGNHYTKLCLHVREDRDPERAQGDLLIGEKDIARLRELLNEANLREQNGLRL